MNLMQVFSVFSVTVSFAASGLAAQIIYSDNFDGTGDLDGTAPDIRPGTEVWNSTITYKADGTINGSLDQSSNALLPFTPQEGNIYQLSMDLTSSTDWVGVIFTDDDNPGRPWFNFTEYHGVGWLDPSGEGGFRPGDGSANSFSYTGLDAAAASTITVELDATDALSENWTMRFSVTDNNGNSESSIALTANSPSNYANITNFGMTVNGPGSGVVSRFELSIIPEPSAYALGIGAFLLGIAFVRRRRG